FLHPSLPALGEDRLEVAFEESARVVQIFFGVGFGGGEAGKRFVEDAYDALLFTKRRNWNGERAKFGGIEATLCAARRTFFDRTPITAGLKEERNELRQ